MIQTQIINGMTGTQVRTALNGNFNVLYSTSPAIFNILDYGAVSNSGLECQTAIQDAMTAAAACGTKGGIVKIPAGRWYITSNIELKSYVSIKCENGAVFYFPDNYAGSVFSLSPGNKAAFFNLNGGYYGEATSTRTWKFLDINVNDVITSHLVYSKFSNITIENCLTSIDLAISSTGWINGNTFENINIISPIHALETSIAALSTGQIEGNFFSNITVQCATWTLSVINLCTSYTHINNFVIWDPHIPTDPAFSTCVLTAESNNNYINGSFLIRNNFIDDGAYNFIVNDGIAVTFPVVEYEVTAMADGLTTGLIPARVQVIRVISANANNIITLPLVSASNNIHTIIGHVSGNGCELRVSAAQAATCCINGVTTNVEAAIPANSSFELQVIDATHWILKAWTALGAEITAIIPDAV